LGVTFTNINESHETFLCQLVRLSVGGTSPLVVCLVS
jgi:hypothetical protein